MLNTLIDTTSNWKQILLKLIVNNIVFHLGIVFHYIVFHKGA